MAGKRPKLDIATAVHGAARVRQAPPEPVPTPARRTTAVPKSRAGKTGIVVYVDPDLARALRHLAIDEGSSLQALGVEALEALLADRGDTEAGTQRTPR